MDVGIAQKSAIEVSSSRKQYTASLTSEFYVVQTFVKVTRWYWIGRVRLKREGRREM